MLPALGAAAGIPIQWQRTEECQPQVKCAHLAALHHALQAGGGAGESGASRRRDGGTMECIVAPTEVTALMDLPRSTRRCRPKGLAAKGWWVKSSNRRINAGGGRAAAARAGLLFSARLRELQPASQSALRRHALWNDTTVFWPSQGCSQPHSGAAFPPASTSPCRIAALIHTIERQKVQLATLGRLAPRACPPTAARSAGSAHGCSSRRRGCHGSAAGQADR